MTAYESRIQDIMIKKTFLASVCKPLQYSGLLYMKAGKRSRITIHIFPKASRRNGYFYIVHLFKFEINLQLHYEDFVYTLYVKF